jgi:hypothetical protein
VTQQQPAQSEGPGLEQHAKRLRAATQSDRRRYDGSSKAQRRRIWVRRGVCDARAGDGLQAAIGGQGNDGETYNGGNLGRMPIMLQLQGGRAEGSERKKEDVYCCRLPQRGGGTARSGCSVERRGCEAWFNEEMRLIAGSGCCWPCPHEPPLQLEPAAFRAGAHAACHAPGCLFIRGAHCVRLLIGPFTSRCWLFETLGPTLPGLQCLSSVSDSGLPFSRQLSLELGCNTGNLFAGSREPKQPKRITPNSCSISPPPT